MYKNFSDTVSQAKGISKKLCFEYNLTQSINQSKFIFFNKHQTYNITKIQNKSQPFTSKVPQERSLIFICCV